jgi:hypothetical protein
VGQYKGLIVAIVVVVLVVLSHGALPGGTGLARRLLGRGTAVGENRCIGTMAKNKSVCTCLLEMRMKWMERALNCILF